MLKTLTTTSLLIGAALIANSGNAMAQDKAFMSRFIACQNISNDQQRLACFDELLPANLNSLNEIPTTPRSSTQSSDQASEENAQQPATPERPQEFGADSLRSNQNFSERQAQIEEPDELAANLISIGVEGRKNVFILDNGQIWKQHPSDTKRPFLAKEDLNTAVTIKKKLFGRHTMRYKGRTIQITRIKQNRKNLYYYDKS